MFVFGFAVYVLARLGKHREGKRHTVERDTEMHRGREREMGQRRRDRQKRRTCRERASKTPGGREGEKGRQEFYLCGVLSQLSTLSMCVYAVLHGISLVWILFVALGGSATPVRLYSNPFPSGIGKNNVPCKHSRQFQQPNITP